MAADDSAAAAAAAPSRCPVAHGKGREPGGVPPLVKAAAKSADAASPPGGCPVVHAARSDGCGGEALDPRNAMPSSPNNQPAAGQRKSLPTSRVTSTIPSGTSGDPLWVYPSEQMFYNAMRRKGCVCSRTPSRTRASRAGRSSHLTDAATPARIAAHATLCAPTPSVAPQVRSPRGGDARRGGDPQHCEREGVG